MKSIEEIKTEHAKELQRAELRLSRAEKFADAGLPIPGYIADGKTHGAIHISFFNGTGVNRKMWDAVQMFRDFAEAGAVSPFAVLRDGTFCTMHPEAHMPPKKHGQPYKRDSGRNSSDYAVKLCVTHNAENGHTSAELEFFAIVGGELYSVSILFGAGHIGKCPGLSPVWEESRDTRNRLFFKHFKANARALSVADGFISYSYGGDIGKIATGADHRFLFVSDTDGDGAECSHALGQLENLANMIGEGE